MLYGVFARHRLVGNQVHELDYHRRAGIERPREPLHAGCAGSLIGAGSLGCLVPVVLFIYCALVLNDIPGLLFWPIVVFFGAMLGVTAGGIVGSVVEALRARRAGERPMSRGARGRWIIVAIILVPSALLAGVMGPTGCWYLDFRQQMRAAEAHAIVVQQALDADGRFPDVRVEDFTGNRGLLVTGDILPGQADEVRRLVQSTRPPVPVKYDLSE